MFLPALIALAVSHYVLAAVALRAAVTAVAAMHLLTAIAEVPLMIAVSPWAGGEVLVRLYGTATDPRVLAVVAVVVTVVALLWFHRRPRSKSRSRHWGRSGWRPDRRYRRYCSSASSPTGHPLLSASSPRAGHCSGRSKAPPRYYTERQ